MDSFKEQQRFLKQTYLREHILDEGYDANEFMQFITDAKEDGANIDNWTMTELRKVFYK